MDSPLIPPGDFVARINERSPGPARTALDPLMMLLWHQASAPPDQDQVLLVTGI